MPKYSGILYTAGRGERKGVGAVYHGGVAAPGRAKPRAGEWRDKMANAPEILANLRGVCSTCPFLRRAFLSGEQGALASVQEATHERTDLGAAPAAWAARCGSMVLMVVTLFCVKKSNPSLP